MILRPCGITSQMTIYRYKRSALVDFIIERPLFPSDWARACRDWLLPPMVALPHACLPVRWWIRFAAAKPRRLKRATGTFLRAGFRIRHLPSAKAKKTFLLECLFCFGGRWWIRTTEVIDDRFTVCSLWPLGKPSIYYCCHLTCISDLIIIP